MKLLAIFIILNVANVILQTFKSIATIKFGKNLASLVNALAYGLYTVVLVYMNCELPLWGKCLVVGGANLVGVWVVKFFEEKARKDKLWKVEVTIPTEQAKDLIQDAIYSNLSYNYNVIDENYTGFNFYCPTQKESSVVKKLLTNYKAKYFVTESKVL